MNIGPYVLANNLFAAPMAGVTDRPFRRLCKAGGAGYAVSEMVTSRRDLWDTLKTSRRANHDGEVAPIAVQIAGTDAQMMAEAAAYNIDRGAQIIDINMGCPAKKVCNKWAGSALMQDEPLALAIVQAVVAACAPRGVPVTLKMRTGWAESHKNAVALARVFEDAGVQMLTVHGRTREQGYKGQAEYDTIAAVKAAVAIPVVANGDIDTPEKARDVLACTGADALMVGRAAQGRPWIFREIAHFLATGTHLAPPLVAEVKRLLLDHLLDHYELYGDFSGVRSARKHIGWYVRTLPGGEAFRSRMNLLEDSQAQWQAVADFFDGLGLRMDRMPVVGAGMAQPAVGDNAEQKKKEGEPA
ncbi:MULTISPECIES: tRNA dihydrouridine synthase DusB [unclassified Polaromonas]|jgi:tRNA-dihydrouridine synthase B|uniref:tRNA dihydrouridine synthase DusB n=1 Tax=unclassified Polaromonas TaxID=2638319 RepID=UPI000BC97B6B|nr:MULTISPECIES: tRNA dihydrouridine synthase DusB [unclassified Polaromonas]OYY36461.1 MAG: tRNA dihydrouridine synthase DusB [Polaromonas sp. 35-63-35]OYZ22696.1 MAG: tRNA dihydrouridine synthase DusB [Polaromonas sp. 16-63-31]OYZ81091.1 MAG: tRNA dihydrouridine synthase DusB [Polaromonas sp. 24-63-21]OZA52690.1 MAG: tRNA dihydrouridine synthase DusB [Polaromonas sp. 17-63-33]OZA88455.1 MAG: tRNA dihydrouridine synthase DusB [Polaromonas sp. 39-63-25]